MKIMAINGSPRRAENTARLLHKALEGAASLGAETEYIDLYPLKYKGCLSCFYCKRKDKEHASSRTISRLCWSAPSRQMPCCSGPRSTS